jgi:hypothetical protein
MSPRGSPPTSDRREVTPRSHAAVAPNSVGLAGHLHAAKASALQRSAGNTAVFRLARAQKARPPLRDALEQARQPTQPQIQARTDVVTIQRNGESAALLADLASPKVMQGPTVQIQSALVASLERQIAAVGGRREASRKDRERWQCWDQDVVVLGCIELKSIPPDDESLMKEAKFRDLKDNSLRHDKTAFDLVKAAGAARLVVTNTLQTMIAARQIEYLRKSGVVDRSWKIVIEVHYYRRRSQTSSQFHKDTLGQTLFVNLNYHTEHPIAGPEYLLNPPLVDSHEQRIIGTLPRQFRDDLRSARERLPRPTRVAAPVIPAGGFVAFVDEAIYHMTPHYGHRPMSSIQFRLYLRKQHPTLFDRASAAYDEHHLSDLPADAPVLTKWFRWIRMTRSQGTYVRPDFLAAGMDGDEVDRMLALQPDHKGFQTVAIPHLTTQGHELPIDREGRPPLKREMSQLDVDDVPEEVSGERSFLRTWVRAVPRR